MNAFAKDVFHEIMPGDRPVNAEVWAELTYARAASASRGLGRFYRNAATYELLLLLAIADGSDEASIYNSVEAVESSALGRSALLKFLHEQAEIGNLRLEPSRVKRSKSIIRVDPSLVEKLCQLLAGRNRQLTDWSDGHGMRKLAAE